uniref:Actin-related protein 6 n=1 Tax=Globodera pallida TaxID=36090 RepID=A0A183BI80_GLOPA
MAQLQTLILDNGAYSIKAGYATDKSARIFPNTVFKSKSERKRIFVADELEECTDRSALFFVLPFERGYLVNWDTQLQVWNRVFGKDGAGLGVDFENCRLLLTDPNEVAFAFADNTEEIVFENFRFNSFLRTSAPSCTAQAHCSSENPCCIVVDSGHSFTHIVPFVEGKIVREGIIRTDVGGKALTNQLKDWISYRQLHVMDETYLINCCKEDCCFVSTNFQHDMEHWRANRVDYILPDFVHTTRGHVVKRNGGSNRVKADADSQGTAPLPPPTSRHQRKPQGLAVVDDHESQQKLTLGVERFALPELLFRPTDVEINQMGLPEALCSSIERLPKEMQLLMARNIVLTGGNALFPGYRKRIELDVRSMLPDHYTLNVQQLPSDPICHPWECARADLLSVAASVCSVGVADRGPQTVSAASQQPSASSSSNDYCGSSPQPLCTAYPSCALAVANSGK